MTFTAKNHPVEGSNNFFSRQLRKISRHFCVVACSEFSRAAFPAKSALECRAGAEPERGGRDAAQHVRQTRLVRACQEHVTLQVHKGQEIRSIHDKENVSTRQISSTLDEVAETSFGDSCLQSPRYAKHDAA